MRHKIGNSPKCYECFYFRYKEAGEIGLYDGFCLHPHQLTYGINGRKREKMLSVLPVMSIWECTYWEDAEDRTTHFEVVTGQFKAQIRLEEIVNEETKGI